MSDCNVFKSCYLLIKFSIAGVGYFHTWQKFWIYLLALFVRADISVLLNSSPIRFGWNREEVGYEVWHQSATQQHEWLEQKYQTVTWVCMVNTSLSAETTRVLGAWVGLTTKHPRLTPRHHNSRWALFIHKICHTWYFHRKTNWKILSFFNSNIFIY